MIRRPDEVKVYLRHMVFDYCSLMELKPVFNAEVLAEALPLLVAAQEHYSKSSEDFLKLGKPIPRLKAVVTYYGEVIQLLKKNYTRADELLLRNILGATGTALVRMDSSNRSAELLGKLEDIFYETLLSGDEGDRIQKILEKLTRTFEEIPNYWNQVGLMKLRPDFLELSEPVHEKTLALWYERIDEYWVERSFARGGEGR